MEYLQKEAFETDGVTPKRAFEIPESIYAFVRMPACEPAECILKLYGESGENDSVPTVTPWSSPLPSMMA